MVSIVTRAKRAKLQAGLTGIRPMSVIKESPLHATQADARKSMVPTHSGKSPVRQGTSYSKCAARPSFFNLSGLRGTLGNAMNYAKSRLPATATQRAQQLGQRALQTGQQATNWARKNPGYAALGGLGGAAGVYAGYQGANAFDRGVVQPMVQRRMIDTLGGEKQVRDLLSGVGVAVDPNTPLGAEHLQAGVGKLVKMQKDNWLAPVSNWWQSLPPQQQQALIMGLGGTALGGLMGGWQGAAAGALGGVAAPYVWPHAQQWLQSQGYMQPAATN